MKKIFIGLLFLCIILFVNYKVLSSTSRHPIDKSVVIQPPTSEKSQVEYYEFGYQPDFSYSELREPCRAQYPTKKAMFGDLHIHTALSADAFPDGTRTFPDDVYRFSKGEAISIPTPDDQPLRFVSLSRPLDFAAVTDHAETFGEGYICRVAGAFSGYNSKACQTFRAGGEKGVRVFMTQNAKIYPIRQEAVCGENFQDCKEADGIVWKQVIASAETAYDRSSDCAFTSFVGYEYTRAPNAMHLHRNTIFKNAEVPKRAATHQSHPFAHLLLQSFETECRLGLENCDVISIPHNSNISGGNAFDVRELEGFADESQLAYHQYRHAYDRLMEITQHKGTSECLNGVSDILGDTDELCDVEALRQFGQQERAVRINSYLPALTNTDSPECTDEHFDEAHNISKGFCLSSRDYARGALLTGMQAETESGVNPFEFGFIGSTDTHISKAGGTDEADWNGHIAYETDLEGRLGVADLGRFNRLVSNPGGLAGVYATENSRDAIFHSMKRREAFATSGTRIEPRFFIGEFSDDLCSDRDWLIRAYENGTPMGSKLPAQSSDFTLLAHAKRDEQSNPLQKLQLIKGWVELDGQKHNKVIDLKSDAVGADQLCATYKDPDYDPYLPTYYYVRAVETPSLRWSTAQCNELPVTERPVECENAQADMIYEMAWTSPIWLTPDYVFPLAVNPHNVDAAEASHNHY